jgi:uncharacterized Ntn-hydrolase superfamily protein
MTFSIIGIDKKNNEMGIACFSKAFGVGGIVPELDLNLGAIAVQSFPNVLYKPKAMKLLNDGFSVKKVLDKILLGDKDKDIRQILLMNKEGEAIGFTGQKNVKFAGHLIGKNCIVGGNMLAGENILLKIKEAFEKSKGDLANKLMRALKAVGLKGDKRDLNFGSAGLIVEKLSAGVLGFGNRYLDLRIDYSKNAIKDLENLLKIRLKMIREKDKNKKNSLYEKLKNQD